MRDAYDDGVNAGVVLGVLLGVAFCVGLAVGSEDPQDRHSSGAIDLFLNLFIGVTCTIMLAVGAVQAIFAGSYLAFGIVAPFVAGTIVVLYLINRQPKEG